MSVDIQTDPRTWDRWKDTTGKWLETGSILTTTPNAATEPIHDQMQVILDPDGYDLRLDPGMTNVASASDLLKPFDARLMRCFPVSTRINSVINDDAEYAEPGIYARSESAILIAR